jgi:hypothetical protein
MITHIKILIHFAICIYFTSDFEVYDKSKRKKKFKFEKQSILILKNNITCLDCFNSIGRNVRDINCKKNLIIAIEKGSNLFMIQKEFNTKVTELNTFNQYYDFFDAKNLVEVTYRRNSIFNSAPVNKTPYIITCNKRGEIMHWPYERIFINGPLQINDSILIQLN